MAFLGLFLLPLSQLPLLFLDLSVQLLDVCRLKGVRYFLDLEGIKHVLIRSLLHAELLLQCLNALFNDFLFVLRLHMLLKKCVHELLRTIVPLEFDLRLRGMPRTDRFLAERCSMSLVHEAGGRGLCEDFGLLAVILLLKFELLVHEVRRQPFVHLFALPRLI